MGRRSRTLAELIPLALILASVAGSLWAVITLQKQAARRPKHEVAAAPKAPAPAPIVEPEPPPAPKPKAKPKPRPRPEPKVIDETPAAVAKLKAQEAELAAAIQVAEQQAIAREAARKKAEADAASWKRKVAVSMAQLKSLEDQANKLEFEAETLELERDVLSRERDAAKAAYAKDLTRSSYAILPHKGPNGTWRRPIVIECINGQVVLQPSGQSFSMLEIMAMFGGRTSPFLAALTREALKAKGQGASDNIPVTPYIFFLVRPDGIRSFYEARAKLEPMGIAFGYELVEQDERVEVPDLDDPSTWDGSAPKRPTPRALAGNGGLGGAPNPAPSATDGGVFGAPKGRLSEGRGISPNDDSPDAFVWGRGPRGGGEGQGPARPRDRSTNQILNGYASGDGSVIGGSAGMDEMVGRPDGRPPGAGPGRGGMPGLPGQGQDPSEKETWDWALNYNGNPHGTPGGGMSGRQGGMPGGGSGTDGGWDRARGSASGSDIDRLRGQAGNGSDPSGDPNSNAIGVPGLGRLAGALGGGSGGGNGAGQPVQGRGQGQGAGGPGQGAGGQGPDGSGQPGGSPGGGAAGGGMAGSPGMSGSPGAGGGGGGPGMPGMVGEVAPGNLDVLVMCTAKGVVVHPGGYRVTLKSLKMGEDVLLVRQILAIVEARKGPGGRMIEPKVRFVVQPDGHATYKAARGQLILAGVDWPTSFEPSGRDVLGIYATEGW